MSGQSKDLKKLEEEENERRAFEEERFVRLVGVIVVLFHGLQRSLSCILIVMNVFIPSVDTLPERQEIN